MTEVKPTHTYSQLFDVLDPATLAGLRDSVQRLGVLVPIAKDQDGNVLDGHHRIQVADDLGVKYRVDVIQCADEQQRDEIRRTLNVDRRQLTGDNLKRHILTLAQLREPSGVGALSPSEIADRSGVSRQYVGQVLDDPQVASTSNLPSKRRGKDGKVYKANRPAVVTAKNEREATRAQEALAELPIQSGVLDVKRAERVAREHAAEQRRAQAVESVGTVVDGIDIRLGDFREVLADLRGTVDAIITDPPYPAEFLPLYDDLSSLASHVLKPNGVLAVMTGQLHMPEYINRLGLYMQWRWCSAYVTTGTHARVHPARVATAWKPVLVFQQRDATEPPWFLDWFDSEGDDKQFHHWGQSESGMASLVSRLSEPGSTVVDPFLGGGTMAIVCRDLGRRFIGCDVDAGAIATARGRLA